MSTSVNSSLASGELLGTGYQLDRNERDFWRNRNGRNANRISIFEDRVLAIPSYLLFFPAAGSPALDSDFKSVPRMLQPCVVRESCKP